MMQELLLQPNLQTELVYKALLIAIEENLYDEVNSLLDRFVQTESFARTQKSCSQHLSSFPFPVHQRYVLRANGPKNTRT